MKDPQSLCKAWIEAELQKQKRLLVYQAATEAAKMFKISEDAALRIITQVLREGAVV